MLSHARPQSVTVFCNAFSQIPLLQFSNRTIVTRSYHSTLPQPAGEGKSAGYSRGSSHEAFFSAVEIDSQPHAEALLPWQLILHGPDPITADGEDQIPGCSPAGRRRLVGNHFTTAHPALHRQALTCVPGSYRAAKTSSRCLQDTQPEHFVVSDELLWAIARQH